MWPLRENILHFPKIQKAPHFAIKFPTLNKKSPLWKKAHPFSFKSSQRSKKQRSVDCECCHMFSSCKHLFSHVCTLCMKTNRDCEFIWQIPGNCDLLRRSHRESWPLIGSCGLSRQRLSHCLTRNTLQTLNVRTRQWNESPLCDLCVLQLSRSPAIRTSEVTLIERVAHHWVFADLQMSVRIP